MTERQRSRGSSPTCERRRDATPTPPKSITIAEQRCETPRRSYHGALRARLRLHVDVLAAAVDRLLPELRRARTVPARRRILERAVSAACRRIGRRLLQRRTLGLSDQPEPPAEHLERVAQLLAELDVLVYGPLPGDELPPPSSSPPPLPFGRRVVSP